MFVPNISVVGSRGHVDRCVIFWDKLNYVQLFNIAHSISCCNYFHGRSGFDTCLHVSGTSEAHHMYFFTSHVDRNGNSAPHQSLNLCYSMRTDS